MTASSTTDRVWDWLCKASVPAILIIGTALITHEVRISRIEDSLFTKLDGAMMQAEILAVMPLMTDIAEIKLDVKEMKARLREVEQKLP
jgi:hypothetical protein